MGRLRRSCLQLPSASRPGRTPFLPPGPTVPTFRFGILQGKEAAPPRRQIPAPRAPLMQQLPALIQDLDPNVCGTKSSGGAQSCRAPAPQCFPWDQRLFRAADKNGGRTAAPRLGQGSRGKDSTPKRHPSSMLSLGKGCAHNPQGPISPPPAAERGRGQDHTCGDGGKFPLPLVIKDPLLFPLPGSE